ncbi:hypothetical protein PTSG_03712 [Salpingoeca rosetta]|uniref:U3 small nucleolar RNA-associated protein 22 n=1 Tax=Salpingoeca rosetta (strain ATCC 50818 / BSB-021) TaxID=946362 RepID=F2U6D3_SALR5|nr:uncharacterized protein PTSG_03712 [Salpingoeca rosetta]EGD83074.1 hypothetical protein PTSG_03712 [Salpingoeca rosetta]|eukprot:XP_004995438.1 hypothetical protein PTSG_03712 [Salpingoeca rosetta]
MGRQSYMLFAKDRIDPRKSTKGAKYQHKKKKEEKEGKQAPAKDEQAEDPQQTHTAILNKVQAISKNMATVGTFESDARPAAAADKPKPQSKKSKKKAKQQAAAKAPKPLKAADAAAVEVWDEDDVAKNKLAAPAPDAEEQQQQQQQVGPSALRSTKQLYALPSRKELETLREADSLFKSGLFRFQMEELLKHVKAAKVPEYVQECVNNIADSLTCFETMKQIKVRKNKVDGKYPVPFQPPLHPKDLDGDLALDLKLNGGTESRQCAVEYVGSVRRSLLAQPTLDVDVCIQMPRALLQHQDRKRFRYLYKRAAFLAHIAGIAAKLDGIHSVTYERFQGDELKPVLCITPLKSAATSARPKPGQRKAAKGAGDDNDDNDGNGNTADGEPRPSRFRIVIHAIAPKDFFKPNQLGPKHNTLDWPDLHLLYPQHKDLDFGTQTTGTATPRYTLRILQDVLMMEHAKFVANATKDLGPNFKEAVLLLKTWLRQRGMNSRTFGVMNGFTATMLLIHLIQQRQVPREASAYQMVRKTMAVIASSKWNEEPLAMKHYIDVGAVPPPIEDIQQAFLVTFVDPSGFCNLLGHMTIGQYDELRFEAARAIKLLDSDETNAFSSLFLSPVDPHYKFDTMIHARLSPEVVSKYPAQLLDRAGNWIDLASRLLPVLLRRGLGDRAPVVVALPTPQQPWKITGAPPSSIFAAQEHVISIGVLLNLETCYRTADILPSTDESDVEAFVNFWGDKATLRALADGSLRHGVVWDCAPHQRHLLVKWIALHVLARHAKLDAAHVAMQPFFFEPVLAGAGVPAPGALAAASSAPTTDEAPKPRDDNGMVASRLASDAFTELVKMVRRLDLPLLVRDLRCVSSTFRLTDPFPQAATAATVAGAAEHAGKAVNTSGEWQPVMEAILQFEGSSRWPDDIGALQQVKLAFLIRIARLLAKNSESGSSEALTTRLTRQYLDVHFRGFVFRIVIFVRQELTLVQKQAAEYTSSAEQVQGAQRTELLAAAQDMSSLARMMRRDMLVLPRLSAWIRGFAVQMASYGPTTRLAKRWIHAHMFSSYVPDELIDLLVLSLYNHDQPYGAPGTPDVGFLRFLHLLASHNWIHDPLFVDPDASLPDATKASIRERFREQRQKLPIMFVATSVDPDSMWTRESPSKLVFQRLVRFARSAEEAAAAALRSVGDGLVGGTVGNALTIFSTPLAAYDVVFDIAPEAHVRRTQALTGTDDDTLSSSSSGGVSKPKFKNLELKGKVGTGRPGWDPVAQLFADLQRQFKDTVMFWYDELGGPVICAAVNPKVKQPHPFKMTQTAATRMEKDGQLVFDMESFVAECMQLGTGVLSKATIQA